MEEIEGENDSSTLATTGSRDRLETFLINLSRGTGLEGLAGIKARNGRVLRPLLVFDGGFEASPEFVGQARRLVDYYVEYEGAVYKTHSKVRQNDYHAAARSWPATATSA